MIFALITNVLTFVIVSIILGVNKKQLQFNNRYKDIVIEKLISNFYNNLEYFPNKEMPRYIYEQPNYEDFNKYYSDEEAIDIVKQDNSYKYYEMKIDEKMSEMYKDLEYLKKHNYSKNRELSNQIKDVVEQFETSIQEHKELKVDTSYSNESRNLYEEIQELQNKVNRE